MIKKSFTLLAALLFVQLSAAAQGNSRISFLAGDECGKFLNVRVNHNQKYRIIKRKHRNGEAQTLQVTGSVSKDWQDFEIVFLPEKSSMITMILTSGKHELWTEYTGFTAEGAKIDNGDFKRRDRDFFWLWAADPVSMDDGFCSASLRVGVTQSFRVTKDVPVKLRFKARAGKARKHPARRRQFDYNNYHKYPGAPLRYQDAKVKYLGLAHKGLKPEEHPLDALWYVKPKMQVRPTEFLRLPGKSSAALSAPVELLEEDGVARNAHIRFGLPLAEGKFKQLGGLCVVDPAGKKVPAQFSAIAFWPDRSVKVALVQFIAPLKAHEKSVWQVKSGANPAASLLKYRSDAQKTEIDTGAIQAVVSRTTGFFKSGKQTGTRIVLTDEQGKKHLFLPEKITVEEHGPIHLTLRLDGRCGSSFRSVVRLGFTAGSPVVSFGMRFINDMLTSEFTDISSIVLHLDGIRAKEIIMDGMKAKNFFQYHDKKLRTDGKFSGKRLSGCGRAGNISFRLQDFWQRYPKAVTAGENSIDFELLPQQPGADFGKDLPFHLYFPFSEGFYRTKWGTAFTEYLNLDLSGRENPAVRPVIARIDRDYVASARVFQGVPARSVRLLDVLDKRAAEAFAKIMKEKEVKREYGFLNWGDSFGERGFNWNNNEYDLARGLFLVFLRSGNRDLYRYALAAVRHQADVDIVHASIIKSVVGGQHQHSVGHSGPSWHYYKPRPWSYPHDANSTGLNGHTWSEGMLTAWCLAGEPFVMDSAHLMGAHFVNYIAPAYMNMRNNERSIGWALRALMPYYRVFGDKLYVRAAKDMVDVVLHEYEPRHGGAWPHRLYGGHAGGHKDAWGGCPFMVGVLLEGLRQYQLCAKDPEVETMIRTGAEWLFKSYSPADVGWPYGASWQGKGYHEPFVQCNFEIIPGMLAGKPESYDAVCDVIGQAALGGISSTPKDFAMVLNMSGGLLDELCRIRPDRKEPIDGTQLWKRVSSAPSKFKIRGPLNKRFRITVTGSHPQVVLRRTRYGGPNRDKEYIVKYRDRKITGKTSTAHAEHILDFTGRKGAVEEVEIRDDMTSYWDVLSSRDAQVEAVVVPGYHLIAEGTKAYSFRVPAGTRSFSITVSGAHRGGFAAAIIRPDGTIAQDGTGRNDGDVLLPWVKKSSRIRPEKVFNIKCNVSTDEQWKIVLLAGGGALLKFDGIPPLISVIK